MPVKRANSTSDGLVLDFACLRRFRGRFHGVAIGNTWMVVRPTSDLDQEESDDEYWGTPEHWRVLSAEALSGDEIDEVAEYLLRTGQASR
jgi:hypothetical protein